MPARPLAGPSAPGRALGALIACPLAGVMFSVPARYEPPLGRASPERALRVESSAAAPGTKVPLAGTNRGLPAAAGSLDGAPGGACRLGPVSGRQPDRKSTRLNSSHSSISYAVFCLKKKKKKQSFNFIITKKKKKHK